MTERPEPSVELVDEGPCKKRLKTEVPAEAVAEELEESYRQLRSTIQLPGFRKGRVPRSVLERRFAGKIEEDVREEMIHSTFQKEMERRELRIVGSPTFDNVEFKRGEPLRYDAVFEVAPSFKLGDYRGLEIEEKPASVADEDVDRELESLREQYATLEPVPFGEQREEDVAVVEFSLVDGEEQCLSRPEVFLKIGSNRVDNIVVDGLTEGLLGASADEELRFAVQIPAEFPRDDLKGRSLELRLSLRELKRKRLPEVDEELARRFSLESVDDLRREIRGNLETRRRVQEENRQEEELIERLADGIDMELPQSIIDERKDELALGLRYRLMRQGKPEEEIEQILAEDLSAEQDARKELKQLFLLDRIAQEEKILVTEEEVAERLAMIARTSHRDPEELYEQYRATGMLGTVRAGLQREKARSFLREKASKIPSNGSVVPSGSGREAAEDTKPQRAEDAPAAGES